MMAYRHPSQKVHKVMVQPINVIFRHLQNRTKVSIWINENNSLKVEGVVVGFDEFMNVVLDEAEEVAVRKGVDAERKFIGRILLKGDNITLMQPLTVPDSAIIS